MIVFSVFNFFFLWLNKSSTKHSSLISEDQKSKYDVQRPLKSLGMIKNCHSHPRFLSCTHTHTHTFSACLIVCLLCPPHGLHFILMTTSAFFSSALISDYGIIIYSVWNSIILLSLLFRYVLYFKYNTCILTGHFSFVLFFDNFLLVVGSDSAFRACLWLFLYTPLLFRPLLRSC